MLGLALGGLLGWQGSGWSHRGALAQEAGAALAEAPAPPPRLGPPRPGDAEGGTSRPGSSGSLKKLIAHLLTGDEKAVLAEFSTEQFAEYLKRHQRDARSLLAVHAFTRDKALLREAYEKHPDNLLVAEQALASLDLSTDEKLALLEKVRAAHPDNALGDLMTANILLKEGKKDEFMRWLQSGLGKTSLDYGEREQRLALREAMMAAGKSPTEARLLAWTRQSTLLMQVHGAASSGIKVMKSMLAEGREEEAFALAGPMLALLPQK